MVWYLHPFSDALLMRTFSGLVGMGQVTVEVDDANIKAKFKKSTDGYVTTLVPGGGSVLLRGVVVVGS
jgi:hypothetical protein